MASSFSSSVGRHRWMALIAMIRSRASIPAVLMACLLPIPLIAQSGQKSQRRGELRGADADWREASRDGDSVDGSISGRTDRGVRPAQPTVGAPRRVLNDRDRSEYDQNDSSNDSDPPARDMSTGVPSYLMSGLQWREYSLAPYTNRLANVPHPEQAVVDWIMRQTGPDSWHGEEISILSATRGRLRVLHRSSVQEQVAQMVERFTRPVQSQVAMRVQYASTTDLQWRSGIAHLLKPLAVGPEGQQIWLIAPEDAALIRNRLPPDRTSGLANQPVATTNGQPVTVESGRSVTFISGLDLAGGTLVSYQPVVGRLFDGVNLSLTPLWTADGSAVDVVIDLTTRAVQKLHQAHGAAPLSSGNQETVIHVPETTATHLAETIRWPTTQVLLISGGMQPQSSAGKRGGFSWGNPAAELIIMAELTPPFATRPAMQR